jgi:hypothetical protein
LQDEISEMKRKFKIMSHQIEQLKEEIAAKDLALVKEHFDHMKVGGSCWRAALTPLHHCYRVFTPLLGSLKHICVGESLKPAMLGKHIDSRLCHLSWWQVLA